MKGESQYRPNTELIVPLCGGDKLSSPLLESLLQPSVGKEAAELGCSIIVVKEAPGFSNSVNQALRCAVERKSDVIIFHPEAAVSSGALTELCQVADLDPLIGFVRPRSNQGSICSLPHEDQLRSHSASEWEVQFRKLSAYLPRFQFIPAGSGPCLYVKHCILEEFGFLDESHGQPGNCEESLSQESDLIMRANRCGYRVALANRAWVSDLRERRENAELTTLKQRYPEYSRSERRYLNGERYEAERLLVGLLPKPDGRLDLLLDLSSVGTHHNGSCVLCKRILATALRLWPDFNIHVMVSDEARRFHDLDRFQGAQFVPLDVQKRFAVALRLAQPFQLEHITRLSRLAAVNVYAMLDPIMFDCQYLNQANADDLETLWATVFLQADGVIYISDFVRDLFHNRFRRRTNIRELVAYPSLDVNDYRNLDYENPDGGNAIADGYILVVGNESDHKRVRVTVLALAEAFPEEKFVCLGAQIEGPANITSFVSGGLGDNEVQQLFSHARFVVYPSLYEGFGLPILESLASEKPVLARSLPITQRIRESIATRDNLILFSSTSDLVDILRHGFPQWRNVSSGPHASGNWDSTTAQIGAFLKDLVDSIDFENVLVPRIAHMHLLGQRAETTGDVTLTFGAPQERIQLIYQSWSWRITAPLRWLGSAYLRLMR
jgi:glycosyltransferase involved in cell wall biosynthesis